MTQMKLIANSRDEWTVKELVETLHAKVNDLERKLDAQLKLNDSIQWHLHAIVLHLTGDRAALTAFAMASEPTVVPNEDEAMPVVEPMTVLASCPSCDTKAYTEAGIYDFFGYRTPKGRETIRQSWCRECRTDGKHRLPPLPAEVTALGATARRLLKDATKLEAKAMTMPPVKRQEMMTTVTEMRAEGLPMEAEYKRLCEVNRNYNRK